MVKRDGIHNRLFPSFIMICHPKKYSFDLELTASPGLAPEKNCFRYVLPGYLTGPVEQPAIRLRYLLSGYVIPATYPVALPAVYKVSQPTNYPVAQPGKAAARLEKWAGRIPYAPQTPEKQPTTTQGH